MDEKGLVKAGHDDSDDSAVAVQELPNSDESSENFGVRRHLSARHITFIAIAGTIGTGLFLNSGRTLATAGPAGLFMSYTFMGLFVSIMMISLGEMITLAPRFGGFITLGDKFYDPALGFAMSITYILQTGMTVPAEMVAVAILTKYWDASISDGAQAGIILGGLILITICNIIGVRYFGEVEFFFCWIKIITLIGLIIFGIAVNCGAGPEGRYIGGSNFVSKPFNDSYQNLEPASLSRFLGFWAALTQAGFSFGGIEGIAFLAGEAKNARQAMATATKSVFIRVILLYCVSVLIIGLNVAQDNPLLLAANQTKEKTANSSAWVVMCRMAGVKVLPSIINAVVMTSAFSAGNEQMYVCARAVMALGTSGYLPSAVSNVSRFGTPIAGTVVAFLFGCLSFLTLGKGGANQAFAWLSNLSTLASFLNWAAICFVFIRYRKAVQEQGADLSCLLFRGRLQPGLAYVAIVFFAIVTIFNGFPAFLGTFNASDFVAAYITIPIFFLAYIIYKLIRKTKVLKISEIDLTVGPSGIFGMPGSL